MLADERAVRVKPVSSCPPVVILTHVVLRSETGTIFMSMREQLIHVLESELISATRPSIYVP